MAPLDSVDAPESVLTPYLPERWRNARLDPGRSGLLALCAVGVVVVIVAASMIVRDAPTSAPVPPLPVVSPPSGSQASGSQASAELSTTDAAPPAFIVVSVVGLVPSSGLVRLPPDSRVADALAAAGGPLPGADVLTLNLAAKVQDGDQITVGAPPPEGRAVTSGTVSGTGAGAGPAPGAGSGSDAGVETVAGPVDLNTATVAELDALNGVGPVTAANIVAWRESNGPFTDVGQLAEVNGIGPARLENLRPQVTV